MTRVGSPGVLGDMVAVAVCEATTLVALLVVQGALHAPWEVVGYAVMIGGMYVALLVTPVAVLGVLVLEVTLRRVRAQWVHVAGAGVLALGAGLVVAHLLAGIDGLQDLRPVAVVAALGQRWGGPSSYPWCRRGSLWTTISRAPGLVGSLARRAPQMGVATNAQPSCHGNAVAA